MKNGLKPDILNKYPIADLFAPAMDSVLRNGIGHNAARYDGDADEIVYAVQGKGEIRMAYTAFVARVLETYSAFELASKQARSVGVLRRLGKHWATTPE
jgi:hypothetical protein